MGEITFSWYGEVGDRYRAILAYNGIQTFQLDCPRLFQASDHFTIFWRGRATPEHLHQFVNSSFSPEDQALRTLFFFPHASLRLPPHSMQQVPSSLESIIVSMYGFPRFLRYEIYPEFIPTDDLRQTRYVVWAAVIRQEQLQSEKEPEKDIGIFTTLPQFESYSMRQPLQDLILKTVHPSIEAEEPREFLNRFSGILKDRIVLGRLNRPISLDRFLGL